MGWRSVLRDYSSRSGQVQHGVDTAAHTPLTGDLRHAPQHARPETAPLFDWATHRFDHLCARTIATAMPGASQADLHRVDSRPRDGSGARRWPRPRPCWADPWRRLLARGGDSTPGACARSHPPHPPTTPAPAPTEDAAPADRRPRICMCEPCGRGTPASAGGPVNSGALLEQAPSSFLPGPCPPVCLTLLPPRCYIPISALDGSRTRLRCHA